MVQSFGEVDIGNTLESKTAAVTKYIGKSVLVRESQHPRTRYKGTMVVELSNPDSFIIVDPLKDRRRFYYKDLVELSISS